MQYFEADKKNFPAWGVADTGALSQMLTCMKTAAYGALMADNHKGYAVPIGGVLAYRDAISPSGVGFDIGCGNKAVLTDADPYEIQESILTIMDDVQKDISFGIGTKDGRAAEHPVFEDDAWQNVPFMNRLKDFARGQLGTVGGGNHYVDIFVDELHRVWVGVHFGSRGLGHKTATEFLRRGGAKDGIDVEPLVLSTHSYLGQEYIEAMTLAGKYAYAGRDFVCKVVAEEILGAHILTEVHNHHNFAWNESHFGESLWVVRKGATPAFPGQLGFVGGSMGDFSYILEGRGSYESSQAMYSTIHGAGRAMSRTAAKGKTNRKTGEILSPGKISPDQMMTWLTAKGVTLRGGDLDEAPQAYKRIEEVIGYHEETINILHVLKPIGVAMAGRDVIDPFKD